MTFHRISLILTALLGMAEFAGAAQEPAKTSVSPTEDPRITQTKLRYQYATWTPAAAQYDGVGIAQLQLPGLKTSNVEFEPGLPIQQTFADADGVKRIAINWTIADNSKQARHEMLGYLTAVNSPINLPSTRAEGIEAGEVGFVGYSKNKRISWIAFTRGNITVRVNCFDPAANPHPNMKRIAEAIDQLIQLQPLRKDDRPLTKPAIQQFTTSRVDCEAGEWVELQLRAVNAGHVQWWVGGSGQAYVSKRNGKWMMRTTGPGKVKVKAQVWSANGYLTESVVREVSVRDDD